MTSIDKIAGSVTLLTAMTVATNAMAGGPDWNIFRPSNTGIPGEAVSFAEFDPSGQLWVGARMGFWGRGGVGVYDGQNWTTHANWETDLPSDTARDIEFDANGAAWIATWDGLAWFDGTNWSVFDSSNSPLPANVISHVKLDQQNRLWMTYRSPTGSLSGVAMQDGHSWTTWSHTDLGFAPSIVLGGLDIDADNNVWVGTQFAGGMVKYDGLEWQMLNASNGHWDWSCELVTFGADGHLWSDWGGVRRLVDGVWVSMSNLEGNHDYSVISPLADGTYWVGTYGGLVAYWNGSSWDISPLGGQVYRIEQDAKDVIWVTTQYGVYRRESNGTWTIFNSNNTGMPENFVYDLTHDSQGRMWFNTSEIGTSSLIGDTWTNYSQHNGGAEHWPFGSESAEVIFEDNSGTVWIGANGVGRLVGGVWEYWDHTNSNLPGGQYVAIGQDANGVIWAGEKYNAIWRFDGTDWERHLFAPYGSMNYVRAITTDHNGTMWVGTEAVLHQFDGTDWTFEQIPGLPHTFEALDVAPNGDLWVGAAAGLARFDGTTWTSFTGEINALAGPWVTDIEVRDDGLVAVTSVEWFSRGGVSIFDGTNWTTYTTNNSPLPHRQVEAVGFDGDGHLWVGATSEGVARILIGESALHGDVDDDGVVGFSDLLAVLAAWGPCDGACPADVDNDGTVGFSDLLVVLGAWS